VLTPSSWHIEVAAGFLLTAKDNGAWGMFGLPYQRDIVPSPAVVTIPSVVPALDVHSCAALAQCLLLLAVPLHMKLHMSMLLCKGLGWGPVLCSMLLVVKDA
jgi:hypothetical protein